jgi:hypothetical protein
VRFWQLTQTEVTVSGSRSACTDSRQLARRCRRERQRRRQDVLGFCRLPRGLPAPSVAAEGLLREPEPATLPRGWWPCKRCSLAIPVRETFFTLCLSER